MCDTLVALGNATADGRVILAKNSDREPNEAHEIVRIPHATHPSDSTVKCTYIEVPQVHETYEVLLLKPFWIWGCEMGANECGVAIGNEAVFTKMPKRKTGLLGMDLMRLALERASTAREALDVIVNLLQTFGQGGACGFTDKKLNYHNSFIIADPEEAWVLETADMEWAAQKVRDVRSISNGLTIGSEWDLASPRLVETAIERGWCKSKEEFHFARCYSDFLYTRFSRCAERQRFTTRLLRENLGHITVQKMMEILRQHHGDEGHWQPGSGSMRDICMHAGNGLTRNGQSVGAYVAHLDANLSTHWVTGTSGTCTSVFKPVYLGGVELPDLGPSPTGMYDEASLWWTHERLHRTVIWDYHRLMALYREERDALERQFLSEAEGLAERYRDTSVAERVGPLAEFSARCFDDALASTHRWIERVCAAGGRRRGPWLFKRYWHTRNRQAKFPERAE